MYCYKCGHEIDDEAVVCVYCGCEVKRGQPAYSSSVVDTPKTGLGVVLGLFLGIIGLVIGICMYSDGTVARKTFVKAWAITFGVAMLVEVVFVAIFFSVFYGSLFHAL